MAGAPERRFVVAIGENHGDPADQTLRFAEADARSFLDAMVEVGGAAPADAVLLAGADADAVRHALADVAQKVAAAGRPTDQLFIYVSSHADEGELHLRGTHLPLRELVDFLKSSPVGVAVLMVDSCRSGALIRLKGMTPAQGVAVSVDLPETVGRVIIASSGADEYAQESQSLGGSYFTHHFVAGLRGAADLAHDGRITLEEAYRYAYARTVESTFATRSGIQHPTYSVDLKGRGSLVLARIQEAPSRLRVTVDAPGEWLLTPVQSGAEGYQFAKGPGPAIFAVAPGDYSIRIRSGGAAATAQVSIPALGEAALGDADLLQVPFTIASAKGSPSILTLGLSGGASNSVAEGTGVEPSGGVVFRGETGSRFLGVLNLLVASASYAQAQGASASRDQQFTLEAGLGRQLELSPFALRLALEVGGVLLRQSNTPPPSPRISGIPYAGPMIEGEVALGGGFALMLGGLAGPELIKDPTGVRSGARLTLNLALGWSL
jgi:hypothetical protein